MKYKKMMRRIVASVLSGVLCVQLIPNKDCVRAASLFDEWDYESLSSRYTRQAEKLDRGVVAVKTEAMDYVFISWRLNGYEPEDSMFNIYRDGALITSEPVSLTNYQDYDGTADSKYKVALVVNGTETETSEEASVWEEQYLELAVADPPLNANPNANKTGSGYELTDVQVGDLNGDGKLDFVVQWLDNDNTMPGMDGDMNNTYYDAYTFDGEKLTLLWRIDEGPNVRTGSRSVQCLLYDFNGDGKAEFVVNTADGTVSLRPNSAGNGTYGSFGGADLDEELYGARDYRYDVVSVIGDPREVGKIGDHGRWTIDTGSGHLNEEGPVYLTAFDGETGEELATIPFDPQSSRSGYDIAVNGYSDGPVTVDGYTFSGYDLPRGASPYNTAAYNNTNAWRNAGYSWRLQAGVAYLNGVMPSIVFQRGIYMGRVAISAYSLVSDSEGNCEFVQEWRADSSDVAGPATSGINAQGYHNVCVGDLDGSGKDSYIIGASAIKYDGTLLWTTGRGHGDAQGLGKFDPDIPGLQHFAVHEKSPYGFSFVSAVDGHDLISRRTDTKDTGRGIAGIWGDFNGAYAVLTGSGNVGSWAYYGENTSPEQLDYILSGTEGQETEENGYSTAPNLRIYWDGDLWDEHIDGASNAASYGGYGSELAIKEYDEETGAMETIFVTEGALSNNGTKKNPGTIADILGDWREEFVARNADNNALRIYTTIDPTEYRFYTFMHDALYRVSLARHHSGVAQPNYVGFYMADRDDQRDLQPSANIYLADGTGIFIDKQPDEEINILSDDTNVVISVEAAANPADTELKYQWYETTGTQNIFSARPLDGTKIDGATESEYTLPEDLETGEHYYYCVVSGEGLGDAVSFVSKVTVYDEPVIEILSQPSSVKTIYTDRDSDRGLSVEAQVKPSGTSSYQWYISANADASESEPITGADCAEYEIPTDVEKGVYYYYCEISADGAQSVRTRIVTVTVDEYRLNWYDGNDFTDTNDVWLTESVGSSSNNLTAVVSDEPFDGISGVIDSYLTVSGSPGGNRALAANLSSPDISDNNEYYFEFDVRFEDTTNCYTDIGVWPAETSDISKTNAIFRLTRNSDNELRWAVNETRASDSGTLIEEFSGSDSVNQWVRVQISMDYEIMQGSLRIMSLDTSQDETMYYTEFYLEDVPNSFGYFGMFVTRQATGASVSVSLANATFYTVSASSDPSVAFIKQPPETMSVYTDAECDRTVAAQAIIRPSENGEPTYQWYGCTSANGDNAVKIEGAAAAEYVIPDTIEEGTYYIFCEANADGIGTARSRVTTIIAQSYFMSRFDGNSFTAADNIWMTDGVGVSTNNLTAEVVTDPGDGIDGVVNSYLKISGGCGGNRALAAALNTPNFTDTGKYLFEFDIKPESITNGFADIGFWAADVSNIGSENPIFRLTRTSDNELRWSVNEARSEIAGTLIEEFSGSENINQWIHTEIAFDYNSGTGSVSLDSLENSDISYTADFSLEGIADEFGYFGVHVTRRSGTAEVSLKIANAALYTVRDNDSDDSDTPEPTKEGVEIDGIGGKLYVKDGYITGELNVNIINYDEKERGVTVILAMYDETGVLKCSKVQESSVTGADSAEFIFNDIYVYADAYNNCRYKIFVWDSLEGAQPLTMCAEGEAENLN